MNTVVARLRIVSACVLVLLGLPAAARAQAFVSPFVGYDFGGDAGCPAISNCEDKKLNVGVAIGKGGVIGFEQEVAYAKNFFGDAPGLSSSVLTVMSNLRIAPAIGPITPYVLGGLGLIKSHVDLTPGSLLSGDNNNFGWNVGGGVAVMFGHVGVRGDVRYFHGFQDLELLGFTLSDLKLDFGRAAAGVVFQF